MALATLVVRHKPVDKGEMNVNVNLSHLFELLKKVLRCERSEPLRRQVEQCTTSLSQRSWVQLNS